MNANPRTRILLALTAGVAVIALAAGPSFAARRDNGRADRGRQVVRRDNDRGHDQDRGGDRNRQDRDRDHNRGGASFSIGFGRPTYQPYVYTPYVYRPVYTPPVYAYPAPVIVRPPVVICPPPVVAYPPPVVCQPIRPSSTFSFIFRW